MEMNETLISTLTDKIEDLTAEVNFQKSKRKDLELANEALLNLNVGLQEKLDKIHNKLVDIFEII